MFYKAGKAQMLIKQLLNKLAILGTVLLTACATNHADYYQNGFQIAHQAGFEPRLLKTESFDLTAFVKLQESKLPIHTYIEGDGFAWATKYQLSANPTPHMPLALILAVQDAHPNVVYLARPCQFRQTDRICDSRYWSSSRFSSEVIQSMNQALGQVIDQGITQPKLAKQRIDLIGYSGGAAVAVLMAVQRSDVSSIRTVAGNLDHDFVNRSHHVDLMPESLNPIDVAFKLGRLPQVHLIGNDDQVIPAETAERFVEKLLPGDRCAKIVRVQADHQHGWDAQWQQLLLIVPHCN